MGDNESEANNERHDEGEVSSIASSIQSQARTFYTLRKAIDEKYVSSSISNLKKVANVVFLFIILLAIVNYVIQERLFSNIHKQIEIIVGSERRVDDLIAINLQLSKLQTIFDGWAQVGVNKS
mmetsp:Transcript_30682/g.22760  ORF Transcript_30682/g.22760 Transcript_30682/m.22760 type:complete len:123 (+) Transcript_30682:786-1154(+)